MDSFRERYLGGSSGSNNDRKPKISLPDSNPLAWGAAPRYEDVVHHRTMQIPNTAPALTPYLGARSRLSQIWLNRWTVLLLLIMVRVILATISLDSDLESARDKAFSACTGVESMGTAMASMPHYMARGLNDMTASTIEAGIHALAKTLEMMITGVQEIVVFVINWFVSTYVCLITLALNGAVNAALDALKELADFVNEITAGIVKGADASLNGIKDAIEKITSKIPFSFLGGIENKIDTSLPALDKIRNGITIPDSFKEKVDGYKKNLPDFKTVKQAGDDAIRIPFQILHNKVNSTIGNYQFDRSVFPIPQKEKLNFCSTDPSINNFFDNLSSAVHKLRGIIIGVILALAFLVMIPMYWRDRRAFLKTKRHAYMLNHGAYDPVDVVYIASSPTPSLIALRISKMVTSSDRRRILVRWAISYITSPPALFVLSLGIAGLLGVLCQYLLLRQIQTSAPKLAAEIGKFAAMVVDKLNNASTSWAASSNEAINKTAVDINENVFSWVQTGTTALNDTLNTMVDTMSTGVNKFLGDIPPLQSAVKGVLDCLIVFKIQGIQKGLTWANENAHISFPTVPEDAFSRGAEKAMDEQNGDSFLNDPGSLAGDKITAVVEKLIAKWEKSLYQEACISAGVVGCWLLLLVIAIGRTLALWWGRELTRGEGGARAVTYDDTREYEEDYQPPARTYQGPYGGNAVNPGYPVDVNAGARAGGVAVGSETTGADTASGTTASQPPNLPYPSERSNNPFLDPQPTHPYPTPPQPVRMPFTSANGSPDSYGPSADSYGSTVSLQNSTWEAGDEKPTFGRVTSGVPVERRQRYGSFYPGVGKGGE
ncbi:hypothetical protein BZA77DRAFT_364819 [Pyronema omphalodes]|nr:hypothetical protein BZA77DRAFT_364819 [Pyronema omphalodes]